jgi:hypothetical protein
MDIRAPGPTLRSDVGLSCIEGAPAGFYFFTSDFFTHPSASEPWTLR